MIAVIKTGGKQYKIKEGDLVKVERLDGDVGTEITFGHVLLLTEDDGSSLSIGTPSIEGKEIKAEIIEQGRGKKIRVVKFKRKVRYRRKKGHRQAFTKVKISKIKA
ncbi:MAG: 50S ribosomal protein L21 [Patescibacteria group bacterium]